MTSSGTFCLFSSNDVFAKQSWLYNVSATDASIISKTRLDGIAYNLHVDLATGACYTVLLALDSSPRTAVVVEVMNGVVTPLIDLSPNLGAKGVIHPGGSTQCSDTNIMWVAVDNGGVGDLLITLR